MSNDKNQIKLLPPGGDWVGGGVRDVSRSSADGNALHLVWGVGYRNLYSSQIQWILNFCALLYILIICQLQN